MMTNEFVGLLEVYEAYGRRDHVADYSGHVCTCESEEYARRIVACVNTCKGIPTETLEKFPHDKLVAAYDRRERTSAKLFTECKAEADALAARLEEAEKIIKRAAGSPDVPHPLYQAARAFLEESDDDVQA